MKLTPLERCALDAILDEVVSDRAAVERQLADAKVISRTNTSGGFFVDLEVSSTLERVDWQIGTLGDNLWIAIDGLEYGLGAILHFEQGGANLLEGYSVGGEDTSRIDFTAVRFALISNPGPLPAV